MPDNGAKRIQFVPLFFAFSFGMILSNLLAQNAEKSGPPKSYELAYRGIDKMRDELPEEIAAELASEEGAYLRKRKALLESAGLRFHLHDYAQQHQLDLDAAAAALFKVKAPTEQEIAEYFRMHESRISKPFHEVRDAIATTLSHQNAEKLRRQRLDELLASGDLILFLK